MAARPWMALLQAVGSGIKLTAAGYMPPATVEQVAQASGVTDWWIGKANREDLTWPVAELRENAQALGLVRKTRECSPPLPVRAALDNPANWSAWSWRGCRWGRDSRRRPDGSSCSGMRPECRAWRCRRTQRRSWAERWRMKDGSQVNAQQAARGARQSLGPLKLLAGGHRKPDPRLLRKMARATLFRTWVRCEISELPTSSAQIAHPSH